jgi:hypothetical protein
MVKNNINKIMKKRDEYFKQKTEVDEEEKIQK